jgi:hypothetical protein
MRQHNKIYLDDVLTINLQKSDITFTRYLYIKDEVKVALLISILHKSDDALFWAYELYYSGFVKELFTLLWSIYYNFFASTNPMFESYFLNCEREYFACLTEKGIDNCDHTIVSVIIQNLIIRTFNTDVFMIRTIYEQFETNIIYDMDVVNNNMKKQFKLWMERKDYRNMCYYLLSRTNTLDSVSDRLFIEYYKMILDIFEILHYAELPKESLLIEFIDSLKNRQYIKINLVSKVLALFAGEFTYKKEKHFYITVEETDILYYTTVTNSNDNDNDRIKPYRVLHSECICGIDDFKMLSLFKLHRSEYKKEQLHEMYNHNWLYHASFSPIWSNRLKLYRGFPNHIKKTVEFINDDYLESFHNNFGYEPDEQPLDVKLKALMPIEKKVGWKQFYESFKRDHLIDILDEELEELDTEPLVYLV